MPSAKKKSPMKKVVHGDDLLYRFFMTLSKTDPDKFTAIAQTFVETMGIWLPVAVYRHSPVLKPWVVRDLGGSKGNWGAPNEDGYLMDDNTQIKDLPRSQDLRGPSGSHLHDRRMGREFVASHIWSKTTGIPLLNSFVPNLVWLPSQISKLSDHEVTVSQTLKTMARKIYGDIEVASHLEPVVKEAWSKLEPPGYELPKEFDAGRLNWFAGTDRFIVGRESELALVIDELKRIADFEDQKSPSDEEFRPNDQLNPRRYREGLPSVSRTKRDRLLASLSRFAPHSD